MKILLVEDDQEIAATIISWFTSERYEVSHAARGDEGLQLLKNGSYDLAILDWELPAVSGIEICKQHRQGKGTTPILMLTGKAVIADRVSGLDAGADDYLTKPFSLKELSARVRALLRRPAAVVENVIAVGDISLDPLKYRVVRKGVEVHLMPRDFALLEFFMRNVDMVYSADALLQRVWSDDSEATQDALRNSVKRLRQKLDTGSSDEESIIENIPRVGYRMRAPKA
jgi:DNA-binding response OmpR family regulator